MIEFYHGSGAQDFSILEEAFPAEQWLRLRETAARLLDARGDKRAAKRLREVGWQLSCGTNVFSDEFLVLHISAPPEEYAELAELVGDDNARYDFRVIAAAVSEVTGYVRFIAADIDREPRVAVVSEPNPAITSATVERALRDAQSLLGSSGAVSAIDRAHTALHGYLRVVCDQNGFSYGRDAGLTELFKIVRESHPRFLRPTAHVEELQRIIRSLSATVDAVNILRNRASVAHPNEQLLEEAEAVLVLNVLLTFLHYLDAKLR